MTVRIKLKCVGKTQKYDTRPENNTFELEFYPVVGGSEENKLFWKYTPSGNIKFSTLNASAAEEFVIGKDYYFDINLAE